MHILVTFATLVLPFLFFYIFSQFEKKVAPGQLFLDMFASLGRIIVAYLVSVIIGWGLAVLFYRGRRAIIALPVLDVLQSFPAFAVLPLAMYFWGPSEFTLIFFLFLAMVWPILFSVLSSLKLVKEEWREAVDMSGLSGLAYLRVFLLPVTIPGLITGSIIGMGEGWEALIATEIIVGSKLGLGNFFNVFGTNPRITALGIFGFLILIFVINKIIWLPLLDWSHRKMEE